MENGKITAVAAGNATITAKAGDKTAACIVTVNAIAPSGIAGTYYMVISSPTGWQPETSAAFIFNADGTGIFEKSGTYTVEDDIITITYDDESSIFYGVIEGKILWLFFDKADASDISKTVQMFYSDTVITVEDRERFVELFGDGVVGGLEKISRGG